MGDKEKDAEMLGNLLAPPDKLVEFADHLGSSNEDQYLALVESELAGRDFHEPHKTKQ
jgi:hypothetical protein